MTDSREPRTGPAPREIPLVPAAVRALAYLALLSIPLILLLRYHYLPFDDSLRHAAKAVSGKPWQDILVLRPGITLDQHPGWHAFLGIIHRLTGGDAAFLVVVSMLVLFLVFALCGLPWVTRPEAWIASLLIGMLASPLGLAFRLTRGRPYLLTMAITATILFAWRPAPRRAGLLIATSLMIALSTWVHGSWYLFALLVAAFALAGRPRDAARLAGCCAAGVLCGAALTGHPLAYLHQQVLHAASAFGHGTASPVLVGEFQPAHDTHPWIVAAVLILLVVRAARGQAWREGLVHPAFVLAALAWILGLGVARFWLDWGVPAALVWMAVQMEPLIGEALPARSLRRLAAAAFLCVALALAATGDLHGRWSTLTIERPSTPANGDIADWLPGDGGIVYSADMCVFLTLFYENPSAPWRYIYGFEAGLMPDAELAVLRDIQRRGGAFEAYGPWILRMKRPDRLVIAGGPSPADALPGLEWKQGADGFWFGRQRP